MGLIGLLVPLFDKARRWMGGDQSQNYGRYGVKELKYDPC